jgi:hypothetical protein
MGRKALTIDGHFIYGKRTKWRMLGGNSGPVVVIHDERLRTNWASKQGPNVDVPTSEVQFSWE